MVANSKSPNAGNAPTDAFLELHRDAIHMNVTVGRYLMHKLIRQAFGQPISTTDSILPR
jgi:hypothetical protein